MNARFFFNFLMFFDSVISNPSHMIYNFKAKVYDIIFSHGAKGKKNRTKGKKKQLINLYCICFFL